MRLVSLCIERGNQLLREITFKDGLNLILDGPTGRGQQSGNNVGKTTVLRLIDFCLGADGDEIWRDSEFRGSINQEVFDLLHGTPAVVITLTIYDRIRGVHSFCRSFKVKGKKGTGVLSIDDVLQDSIATYRDEVKNILFGTKSRKPSLRQLAPKFVRSSAGLMSKTLKFLGPFGKEVDYEAVHLFLFGFFDVDVLEERSSLNIRRGTVARDLLGATRQRKEGEIEQLLLHLRRKIDDAQASIHLRGEVSEITAAANAVSKIRAKASDAGSRLAKVEAEIASVSSAIESLKHEYSGIDDVAVKSIYSEAGKYNERLHRDWEELSDFVVNLRGRKERFLQLQVHGLKETAASHLRELERLQEEEDSFVVALRKTRAFEMALEAQEDLHEMLKQVGRLEESLHAIQSLRNSLEHIDEKISLTRKFIEEGKARLTQRVSLFNKFFSSLSKDLYGEQYLLTFDESKNGSIVFSLTSVGANVGAGKKVSQTAAFDIAYIKFLHAAGINFPTFVCHDGVEAIHGNQLSELLTAANSLEGQLILAAISDKLPGISETFLKENTILQLSQDDKLFRL
ncbi:DUF2326 domain-containing protein [Luteibacter aegosomaticola]|uniref:DUF2326 domain-containing protein n=1 Tax=Luteibacter aegosomaticola TaxID=2911538 RepID=UPI001FFB297E|nr:DUF2326 domain-containing protein [Luteibacter aegosomaticola]UPG89505.1 DUF2326 domain-containing protein [Luteibacter aegosomaticola]